MNNITSRCDCHVINCFWKRERNNDNYDLYLKTIFNAWANSLSKEIMLNEQKVLNILLKYFEKWPEPAEEKIRKAFQKRKEDNIDYLSAIMLVDEEYRNKTKKR